MGIAKYRFLGERLKKEREKKKITQEQLAELVGCTAAHISHIETGNTIPSLKVIIDIVNQLEISSDVLLCDYLLKADIFKSEINDIMQECTENEIKFIVENARESLRIFRKYNN